MNASASPKKRLPAKERRKQILQCAIRVFARSNYQSTRISDIAKEAGVSEAMIYKHFPKKKQIFLEALNDMSARLALFWEKELGKETNALALLRNMVLEYHRQIKKHPDELKLQIIALSEISDPDILQQLQRNYRLIADFIRNIITTGLDQGIIRKDLNIEALTYLNIGGGALTHIMALLSMEKDYTENLALATVDLLIDSIQA